MDATFGALSLTVAPPLVLRTPLQAATAYVAGKRTGSVLFVAQTPGWYTCPDARPLRSAGRAVRANAAWEKC